MTRFFLFLDLRAQRARIAAEIAAKQEELNKLTQ